VRHDSPVDSAAVKDALDYFRNERGMDLTTDTVLDAITACLNSGVKTDAEGNETAAIRQRALRPTSGFLEWKMGLL